MAFLKIKVHSPVGVFEGLSSSQDGSMEDVIFTRDRIQERIDSLSTLTLFPNRQDPESHQITLPGTLLKNSVVEFMIL